MAKRANVRTVEEKKSARSLQRDATLLRRSPQFRWDLPSKIGRQLPAAALGQGNARAKARSFRRRVHTRRRKVIMRTHYERTHLNVKS